MRSCESARASKERADSFAPHQSRRSTYQSLPSMSISSDRSGPAPDSVFFVGRFNVFWSKHLVGCEGSRHPLPLRFVMWPPRCSVSARPRSAARNAHCSLDTGIGRGAFDETSRLATGKLAAVVTSIECQLIRTCTAVPPGNRVSLRK
jgi:hypothetical protein